MPKKQKYSGYCQLLINTCQAVELVSGAAIVLTLEGANRVARTISAAEMGLFDVKENTDGTFAVSLR